MTRDRAALILMLSLLMGGSRSAGAAALVKSSATCPGMSKTWELKGKVPVVFANPVEVPGFRIRLLDTKTLLPVSGKQVVVGYDWQWWEYPSSELPERTDGGWARGAYDEFVCTTDANGEVLVPAHKVELRGWYSGEKLKKNLPKFTGLGVGAGSGNVELSARQLSRIREPNFKPFFLTRTDRFVGIYRYEIHPLMSK